MMSRIPPADSAPAVPRKIVGGDVPPLKRDALHLSEQRVGTDPRLDGEGLDGFAKKA
jgi:hypothetical protein